MRWLGVFEMPENDPAVVIHDKLEEPLYHSKLSFLYYGCFDPKTNTIHIFNRDLLFNLVLTHEFKHWQRRNIWYNRLRCHWSYPYFGFFPFLLLPFFAYLNMENFEFVTLIAGFIFFGCILTIGVFAEYTEEKICHESAQKKYEAIICGKEW